MLFVGITGGVGAGKSAILNYLSQHYNCRVMLTDEIAHLLMEPGTACYEQLKKVFEKDAVFCADGQIDRPKLAAVLFSDEKKRTTLNEIVHPAVKEYVKEQFAKEQASGKLDVLVVEAALLIEEHYDEICDELWYIYTTEANRRIRLKANRGYSDEKIDNIFNSQLSEEEFRAHCVEVIDNNGTPEQAFAQIDEIFDRKMMRCAPRNNP
jgi:dephospho-CoA kinase